MRKGAIYQILQDVYKVRCREGRMLVAQQRIIRMRISLKTGLNLRDFTPESPDSSEDVRKVLDVVRGPGIGLSDYTYEQEGGK